MKLYDGGRVPNARRVRVYLAEKGLTVPLELLDLGKNAHKTEAFTAINPHQRVPVLVLDDGTVITESIAICRYFEELHPTPPLFGEGAKGRAIVEMWQRQLEFELYLPTAHVFRHTHPAMAGYEVPQIAEWGAVNKTRVSAFLSFLDTHLAGKAFICGEAFSVADITGMVTLDFFKAARITIPEGLANVRRWHELLSARPSSKA